MSITRTLAATAASAAIAAALLVGIALPANAGPINPGPISPINPGPSTPVPPGGFTLSYFSIGTCANMASPRSITATAVRYPGFGPVATPAGAIAADATTLQNIVRADHGVTCAYGVGGVATVLVTETKISASDYKILKWWYDTNSAWSHAGGGPTIPGGTLDTQYSVGSFPNESATISPNGWWITVKDVGHIGALPYFEMDAVEQFFVNNPRLALITR